jgi:iron complex transport system substrate-binding protein
VRIASLVPSATELLFALGIGDRVVAVTHECDYPPGAEQLPHLTRSVIPEGLDAGEIDRAVRERTGRGEALYELDEDVLADVPRLAEVAEVPEAGERLAAELGDRLEAVERAVEGARRPRVAALEWLDPVYIGGHWVPQMIELAGGEDVLGLPGEKSRTADWSEVESAAPEVVVSMPCGYYAEEAAAETMRWRRHLGLLNARVIAVDAAAYFSRPGPRLVDGVELLGHLLHPELVPAPPARRSIELDLDRALAGHGN